MYSNRVFPYICELSFGNPCGENISSVALFVSGALFFKNKLKE